MPKKSLLQLLREKEELSEFVSLLEMGGLEGEVGAANFSGAVLAPTNEALEEYVPEEEKEALLEDLEKLRAFLSQHILTGWFSLFSSFYIIRNKS